MTRLDQGPLPDDVRRELAPGLKGFAETGGEYLRSLGDVLARDLPPPSPDGAAERVQVLNEALRSPRQRGATSSLQSDQAERVFTLAFAVQELSRNFEEIARLFAPPDAGSGPA